MKTIRVYLLASLFLIPHMNAEAWWRFGQPVRNLIRTGLVVGAGAVLGPVGFLGAAALGTAHAYRDYWWGRPNYSQASHRRPGSFTSGGQDCSVSVRPGRRPIARWWNPNVVARVRHRENRRAAIASANLGQMGHCAPTHHVSHASRQGSGWSVNIQGGNGGGVQVNGGRNI